MRNTWLVMVMALGACALTGNLAHAKKPKPAAPAPAPKVDPDADTKKAIEEFKLATKHYNLNEFEEAIKHYREAYRLKSDAAFLFNIAQSYRQSGDYDSAIKFYKSYLRDAPKASNRKDVEAKIEEMKRALEARTSPPTEPIGGGDPEPEPDKDPEGVPDPTEAAQKVADEGTTPPPPAVDQGGGGGTILKKWWFWTAIGVVVVGGTAVAIASSGGGGTSIPDSTLGDQYAF